MVEVIACSAAAGIARELQQQKALQAHIQFEQFFTPQLARELEANPSLLDSQDADISVVFCDIVGFSAISHRIGSTLTMQWINDVMELLSAAVFDNEGVVVDYIGDEMMAMWGAPKAYADHAAKACFAAEQMFRTRKEIDAQWLGRTGQSIDFRIGICSGKASVGNAGSRRRLKYGPLGDTVNLASRLQSAAKQLDVRQLVGAATAAAAGPSSSQVYRPLGTARFVNISEPFEMGELGSSAHPEFVELAERFVSITDRLRTSNWDAARSELEATADRFPEDIPTRLLLYRLWKNKIDPSCIWPFQTK